MFHVTGYSFLKKKTKNCRKCFCFEKPVMRPETQLKAKNTCISNGWTSHPIVLCCCESQGMDTVNGFPFVLLIYSKKQANFALENALVKLKKLWEWHFTLWDSVKQIHLDLAQKGKRIFALLCLLVWHQRQGGGSDSKTDEKGRTEAKNLMKKT